MKPYTKIVLLVALALFLTLTACTRTASTSPVASATPGGVPPFPVGSVTPGSVTDFATQTALAKAPQGQPPAVTATPKVVVATATPGGQGAAQPTATTAAGQQPAKLTPVVAPPVTRPANYTLQNGEWPICIARRYNLAISSFFSANGLSMASKPSAGTSLKIPATGTWEAQYGAIALAKHPTTYTVVSGDTVYTIACKYGNVAPEQILAVNGLAKATDIKAGLKLQIP